MFAVYDIYCGCTILFRLLSRKVSCKALRTTPYTPSLLKLFIESNETEQRIVDNSRVLNISRKTKSFSVTRLWNNSTCSQV